MKSFKITQSRTTGGHLVNRCLWMILSPRSLLAYQRQKCISQTERWKKAEIIIWAVKNIVLSSPHKNTFTLRNTLNKTLHKQWANECNLPRFSNRVSLCFEVELPSTAAIIQPLSWVPCTVGIHNTHCRRKGKFAAEVIQPQRSPWTILQSRNLFQSDVKLSVST